MNSTASSASLTSIGSTMSASRLVVVSRPGMLDIIIGGRGRMVTENPGNEYFTGVIQSRLGVYSAAITKADKSKIIMEVFESLTLEGARFLKHNPKEKVFYVVEGALARTTIGQTFRDNLSGGYRSSKHYKRGRRSRVKMAQKQAVVVPEVKDEVEEPFSEAMFSALSAFQQKMQEHDASEDTEKLSLPCLPSASWFYQHESPLTEDIQNSSRMCKQDLATTDFTHEDLERLFDTFTPAKIEDVDTNPYEPVPILELESLESPSFHDSSKSNIFGDNFSLAFHAVPDAAIHAAFSA